MYLTEIPPIAQKPAVVTLGGFLFICMKKFRPTLFRASAGLVQNSTLGTSVG